MNSFRFGVVAGHAPDLTSWTAQAERVEKLGFDTLLATDPVGSSDPFVLLGAAAAVTIDLTIGTFVLADPFRDARALDWQAKTLHQQTRGRFELGLGVGRPGADGHATSLGREFPSPSERITRMAATIAHLKRTPDRPPLMLAAGGPKMLALAAQEADIVTFTWMPRTTEGEAQSIVDRFRELAGARLPDIELGLNLMAVGTAPSPGIARWAGVDVPELAAEGAVTVLPEDPGAAAETLLRWRERWGISYVTINSGYAEPFAAIADETRKAGG
ncbi:MULTISPECIES: LLM class flavin-dependent oxidoreductase [unclassified Amycolatopsis]|uniref:LLM class flavin-dependent oxidoreductase n=1 Tax=unclassified Amycolatopsis TaxID=2618356 RepID=UPI0028770F90|nr:MULTISPECIES: LLM class flavin-dependent oxidoreductase [unclassified Amycolatopsis]MDS0133295.1 LLM class flavin-dependent oxidoreductase [Amycolatopsis sp. 505]MDS0146525.1 LLM class flavin-dependent oxidoreductase [Amycolatopsis sp. CM201R]